MIVEARTFVPEGYPNSREEPDEYYFVNPNGDEIEIEREIFNFLFLRKIDSFRQNIKRNVDQIVDVFVIDSEVNL